MTEFAHTYDNESKVSVNEDAEFTLVLYQADGKVQTVDSNEMPALKDSDTAIDKAMFAINGHSDHCEVYNYGEYYGKAEYEEVTHGWFVDTEVMFSTVIW